MSPLHWAERFHRRMRLGAFLQTAGEYLAGFLLLFGGLVLTAKLLLPVLWPHAVWVLALIPVVVWLAWRNSALEAASEAESIALLDQRMQAGGLLMSLAEADGSGWESEAPHDEHQYKQAIPKLRPVRLLKLIVIPLVFAITTGFVPLREIDPDPEPPKPLAEKELGALKETLEVLTEAEVIEKQESDELKQEIEQLEEQTRKTPLTHEQWEVVDALKERMRQRLNVAQMQLSKALSASRTLEKAAKNDQSVPLTVSQAEELSEDVIAALQKFKRNQDEFDGLMKLTKQKEQEQKEGINQPNRAKLMLPEDAEERRKALEELQEFLEAEAALLQELRDQLGLGEGEGLGDGEGDGEDGEGPGSGGLNRGPGHARLGYRNETDESDSKFKAVVLPPGYIDEPDDETIAITATAPEENTEADPTVRGTARETDAASGFESRRRTLRPSHRDVIRRYTSE